MDAFSHLTKILTAEQIRQADQYTIDNQPIASIDLMEKASKAFVSWFLKKYGLRKNIKIFCGMGNNGGDGLAISRLLTEHGCDINTFCIGDLSKASQDFKTNYDRLCSIQEPEVLNESTALPKLVAGDIVIDALFGSGLSRPVTGFYADLINHINTASLEHVIAIDIASGMFSDQNTSGNVVVHCDQTVSFQIPKLAFYLPQNYKSTGKLSIVDIGLNDEYIQQLPTDFFLISKEYIRSIHKKRKKFDHKGKFGHNLIIAGSKGKIGAAVLATKACLRSGAGLVTTYVPECGYSILQTAAPEAMAMTDPHQATISEVPDLDTFSSVGIGPGIGTEDSTAAALANALKKSGQPLVLDADALNIISQHGLLDEVPKGSILTPHPGEFERMAGSWGDDFQRLEKQRELSKKYEIIILLKGAHSSISEPSGRVCFNITGNPGMATGGSGDVLTGVITALLGQGYTSFEAAVMGAYIHGLAGNLYVKEYTEEGLTAGDLINYLPKTFQQFGS